jgi:uncharacterized protein DUF4307
VTETNATVAFPPGRYGRRRDPRAHRRWLPAVLTGLVIVAGVAIAYQLTGQYGAGRPYDPTVERFYDVTDEQVVVEFTVLVPDGETAVCVVRARGVDGAEVGRDEIRLDPPPGATRTTVTHRLATTARPVTGEVQRCWADR